ncbi:alanine--tRNA ligase [Thomasclavelia spiroformis DSM 1552]|uniref:Alanine--tRNA ligase n=1 Tax=Thomasclavelia spiroformis DSM 1552 TaxID=428126 RepID=B1C0S3_9FIRM|nr:alanine--tRNA ligase [Thomasclavelia spiroformis]EDS75408.1 alanine--tRNA ligase [Thomasclavelia spiroformis DSM 1552]MBS6114682.1 alanine--tRNA ligase [Thomasclavelia spiroformis]UWO88756.1 alanine--tRNA ligase [Thomasclavelia spiroformis DSM 1552]
MKQLTGNQVRKMFLDFFESKGHKVEPSHSLIPNDDPTLLWINAGVAALKKYFDGTIKPENPRITNAQKSIRTNDIENVGKTARHHTFFEMLGNFSIGDYFKKEAIDFAWELLTDEKWFAFDKDKLYITVHDHDEEAYNYWVDVIGVEPSHMLKTPGNFWEIGEGPCGPDSEIFYDRGEKYDPEGLGLKLFYEELENDRYIEIWNLVFSQYNSQEGVDRNDYEELPQKNIDTGMGLERITSIIQDGETNFDTDFFLPIIHEAEKLANVSYQENKMAYRVIADHIRTVTFALADGALFDNAGRGYVLRRILRRAVRYGKQIGIEKAFMYNLVGVVSEIMKEFYDYLPEKVSYISDLVKKEEEAFHKTLSNGEKLLSGLIKKNSDGIISGKDAFKLYDTYGFPFELTLEIAQESNLKVDEEGFKEELKLQQMRSRGARVDNESMTSQKPDLMAFDLPSSFEYDPTNIRGVVIGLFKDGVKTDQLNDYGEIVFDVTTFYAEMGGQCADTGIVYNDECKAKVVNVLKAPNQQHLHFVELESGSIKVGDVLTLEIDKEKRGKITANHTATHILQAALKEVIGSHINQAGSYVDDNRLRFDFTHFEKITNEQLKAVEQKVNDVIFKGIDVEIANMSKEEALASGAMALFDEKYGDTVRVVSVGNYSKELCGGCHVTNSSNIGLFKIETEESVGSGIRRIEAVTGKIAYEALVLEKETVDTISSILKLKNRKEVVNKVTSLTEELNAVKKEVEALNSKLNALNAANRMNDIQDINGVKVLFVEEDMESNKAKQLAFDLRDKIDSGIVILVSKFEEKCSYFVGVSKDYVASGIKAGDVVKKINAIVDGRGGGKPDFAQGGCPVNEKIDTIKDELKNFF